MAFNGRPVDGWNDDTSQIYQGDQDLIPFSDIYSIARSGYDEYGTEFTLSSPEYQSGVYNAVTNVDFNEFQNLVKPNTTSPWTYGQSRNQQAIPSFVITDPSSRAWTVAGDPIAEYNVTQRPALQQRLSQDDSGFSEIHSIPEVPEEESSTSHGEDATEASYVKVPAPAKSVRSVQTAPSSKKRRGAKDIEFRCLRPHCDKVSKSRSDAEKHHKQHLKLFKCNEPRCPRTKGFGTPNDLERHQKSVHNRMPTMGKPTAYICQACPQDDKNPKRWPRLDNFKAHIDRKHEDYDRQALIKSSEILWIGSESGYGGSQDLDSHEYDDMMSSFSPSMPRHPSYASQGFLQDSSDTLAGIGAGPGSGIHSPLCANPAFQRMHVAGLGGSSWDQDRSLDQKLALVPYFDSMHAGTNLSGMQIQDDSLPADLDLVGMRPRQTTDENNQKVIICPYQDCGKVKHRLSEYRKHLKRHTRPYGCTFTGCTMRLGSRNDWKRHESSQHSLLDQWFCSTCRLLFSDSKDFTLHLQHVHHVPHTHLTAAAEEALLGKDGHFRFWCGFCKALIPQMKQGEGQGMDPWESRFKHIGDHYDKGNFLIGSWVRIDQAPHQIQTQAQAHRKRAQEATSLTMATRPRQMPNVPASSTTSGNNSNNAGISQWLAPPPPTRTRKTNADSNTKTSMSANMRMNTPSRMTITTANDLSHNVPLFFPQHDSVHSSNAGDSLREFEVFEGDGLEDAEGEEDTF